MATEKLVGAGSGALAGAALGAKIGAAGGPIGMGVGALVGGLAGLFGTKSTKKVPDRKSLDIAKLIEDARKNSETNLSRQLELESKYLPEQAAFRKAADTGLASRAAEVGSRGYLDALMKGMGESTKFLPEGSAGRAILDEAKLGAGLTADVQAEIAKGALEGASTAGIAGSAAGRGLVARDIGLSSAALRQARLAAALGVEQTVANQFLQGEQLRGGEIARLGALSQTAPLPEAGLSAGSIADLTVAEQNAANQYAANRVATENAATQQRNQMLQGLFGQVSGGGLTDIFKTTPPASSASANPLDFSNNNLFGPAGAPSANLKFGLKK